MIRKKTANTATAVETEVNDGLEQPESKVKIILNKIINVILVIAIIIAAFATYSSFVSSSGNGVTSVFGIRVLSIQTESMYPTLEPGDLIFERGVQNTSMLQVGDIITYWTVINGERVLNTHRISEIYDGGNYLIFETKGDNNTVSDALTVHESEIVGQWKNARIKGLGKVFDYLQTSTGFLIVVVIPVAIFFVFHLIQFFRVLFEYQNVKQKLQYEMERGKTEEYVEEEKRRMNETRAKERASPRPDRSSPEQNMPTHRHSWASAIAVSVSGRTVSAGVIPSHPGTRRCAPWRRASCRARTRAPSRRS